VAGDLAAHLLLRRALDPEVGELEVLHHVLRDRRDLILGLDHEPDPRGLELRVGIREPHFPAPGADLLDGEVVGLGVEGDVAGGICLHFVLLRAGGWPGPAGGRPGHSDEEDADQSKTHTYL
jgi:hypothetical protein